MTFSVPAPGVLPSSLVACALTPLIALDNLLHIVIITAIHADTEPGFAGTPVSPGENLDPGPDSRRASGARAIACPPRTNWRKASRSARSRSARRSANWPDRPHPPRAGSRHLRAAAAAHRGTTPAQQLQRGDAPAGRPGVLRRPRAGHRRGVGRRGVDARPRRGGAGLPPAPAPPRRRRADGRADGLHPGPVRAAHRGHRVLALVALRRAQRPLQPRARQRARDALRVRGGPTTRRCSTSTRGRR